MPCPGWNYGRLFTDGSRAIRSGIFGRAGRFRSFTRFISAPAASSETPKEIDWPKRTITVQTVTAGGDQDFLSRWLAVRIKKDMGANVVVVNNDNSVIASRNVLGNDPDGYTVMLGKSSTCIEKVNGAFEGFDFDSFEYLGTLTENPAQCIAVKPKLGVKTLPELIEYSKQHPGELRITDNIGSNTQVTVKLLEDLGAQFTSVDVWRELRQDDGLPGRSLRGACHTVRFYGRICKSRRMRCACDDF